MKTETYINGDRGTYTGETQMLHGGLFWNVLMHEGKMAGKIAVTQHGPNGENPLRDEYQKAWKDQQKQFSRLHRKKV